MPIYQRNYAWDEKQIEQLIEDIDGAIGHGRSDFGFERIVFSYLDYLLYRDGYSFDGKEIISPLRDDWQFQFRSKIYRLGVGRWNK